MATKFYNVEKAAEALGLSPAEVNALRERQQLHGYRDGADWKFKADEVDQLAQQLAEAASGQSDEDVLLSEVELGESGPGTSGTVIGPPPDLEAEESETLEKTALDSAVSSFEDLDLTMTGSQLDMAVDSALGGDSTVDLSVDEMDDDDLVLGGSGTGSDITLGGDSGISLVDPTDSGLSLEEPLDLSNASSESLDLGGESPQSLDLDDDEDDILALAEASTLGLAPTPGDEIGAESEDEFMLTPMDDGGDAEEGSGSQVIALDGEGGDASGDMGPMFDSSISMSGVLGAGALEEAPAPSPGPFEAASEGASRPQPAGAPAVMAMPEAAYSVWSIVSLSLCTILLAVVGMFLVDLMRNMWSWGGAVPLNSSLMDLILGR